MELSTFEAWEEEQRQDQQRLAVSHPDYVQHYVDRQRALAHQRNALLVRFPYSVVAAGLYDEHDYARRWCWQNIGPENGPCHAWQSGYPACPLVLATEHWERGTWKDKNGKELSWAKKRYTNPGDHEHAGEWSFLWFGKAGYDFGYGEYCFENESDQQNFLAVFPTFTWSEAWDKEK